jgi:rhamnosyltransferase
MSKRFAIVVCYYPVIDRLRALVDSVSENARVIVVDNTPSSGIVSIENCFQVVRNNKNLGIAAAQNVGVETALSHNAETLMFLDQDTIISSESAAGLFSAAECDRSCVFVPLVIDARSGKDLPYYSITKYGFVKKTFIRDKTEQLSVHLAISSGTTCHVDAFRRIGPMNESFFIDYVDFEWMFRAKNFGVSIKVVPCAAIFQTIGKGIKRIFGRDLVIHNAERSYFRLRNSFWMLRLPHVPSFYAARLVCYSVINHIFMTLCADDRSAFLSVGLKAVVDGVSLSPQSRREF